MENNIRNSSIVDRLANTTPEELLRQMRAKPMVKLDTRSPAVKTKEDGAVLPRVQAMAMFGDLFEPATASDIAACIVTPVEQALLRLERTAATPEEKERVITIARAVRDGRIQPETIIEVCRRRMADFEAAQLRTIIEGRTDAGLMAEELANAAA